MKKSYYLTYKELKEMDFNFIGKKCKISSLASFVGTKNISILEGSRIDDFTLIVANKGSVKIGKNTHIGGQSYIQGWCGVEVGSSCKISQGVKIYSKSDNYLKIKNDQILKKVKIYDNVIIGSNSIILPGTIIEKNCRIGALTVVDKKIKKSHLFSRKKLIKIN